MKPLILLLLSTMALFAVEDSLPPELARLQELRAREVEKINKVYLKELMVLKTKFMKKGDLDGANRINQEIKKYSPESSEEAELKTTRWNWGSGSELVLRGDGIAQHTGWRNSNGKWKRLADGSIHLEGGNGVIFKITFTSERIGQVESINGSGKTTITLKK